MRSVWMVLRGKLNQRLLEDKVDDRLGGCDAVRLPFFRHDE